MKAQQIFNELNFKQVINNGHYIKYENNFSDRCINILFKLKEKEIEATDWYQGRGLKIHDITLDELKAIISQAEELGWLDKKEKVKTNLEHYMGDILKLHECWFGITDGKIKKCCDTNCFECALYDKDRRDCDMGRFRWLASPYKKQSYRLTQFEYDLLYTNNRSHDRKLSSFVTYKNLKKIGYFKYINFDLTINEILNNCEVKEDE